jgi:hypothetical protein
LSSASNRGTPTCGPNSPLEIGLGEIMPREIQPEIASKSKVRQTSARDMCSGAHGDTLGAAIGATGRKQ